MNDEVQPENLPYARELTSLPIFAQTLVACRLSRRAVLANLDGIESEIAQRVCDVIESITEKGKDASYDESALNALAGIRTTSKNKAALTALRLTIDAVRLAHCATGYSSTERVAALMRQCIETVWTDPHFARMQVAIILKGDIDQIKFACAEVSINIDQGVSDYVLSRLTPCHALSVFEPRRPIEEEYR